MSDKCIKWDITSKCNLRCKHCLVGKKYFVNKTKEITLDQKLKIIDKLLEGGVGQISILGGEPLTMDDEFFSLIDYGVSRGLKISVVTNGILLNGEIMERVAKSGIDQITISMEGASEESHEFVRGKNTFNKLTSNIKALTEYISKRDIPLQVNINTVLNRLNYPEIDKMIDICMQLGVNQWKLLSLCCTGFAEDNRNSLAITSQEEIDAAKKIAQRYSAGRLNKLIINTDFYPLLYDYIQKKYNLTMPRSPTCCNASISFGYIDPDGNMYPCDRFSDSDYIGRNIDDAIIRPLNLVNYSFYEIWNSNYFINTFKLILNSDTYQKYDPCNHCKYLKNGFCNPCPLYSLNYSKVNIELCQIIEK
jgi:radical SAM protein with 4Fe4S-binding SPASM domain